MSPTELNQKTDARLPKSKQRGATTLRWIFIRVVHLAIFFFSLFGAFLLRFDFSVGNWWGLHFFPVFWFIVVMKFLVFRHYGL